MGATWYSPPLWRNSMFLRHWQLVNPNRCEWEGELTAELIKEAYGEKDGLTESGSRRFYWTVGILKAPEIRPWFYPLWWKHGVRCDVKTLHGVWGPLGPSVPEAPAVQPASRSSGYSFPAEVQPETAARKPREPGVPSGRERRTPANSRWGAPIIRVGWDLCRFSPAPGLAPLY